MHHRHFASAQSLISAAADTLVEAFQAPGPPGSSVMLSGGGTPLPVYAEVARRSAKAAPAASAFFSDERMVPRDDEQSNFANARPMLQALGLEVSGRVLAVATELPIDEAAEAYEMQLRALCQPPNRITLGILGVGPDGHTASLFSPDDVARGRGRLAIPVRRTHGPDRVSVTADFLAHVERLVFLMVGPEKAAMAERLLHHPTEVIAAQVVAGCSHVELWTADLHF